MLIFSIIKAESILYQFFYYYLIDEITIYFERPNDTGFDFAEGKLPNNIFYKTYGFSEDELLQLEQYLRNNSFLIWEIAREKEGVTFA